MNALFPYQIFEYCSARTLRRGLFGRSAGALEEIKGGLRKAAEEVIEVRYSTERLRIRVVELVFYVIGIILLLILGVVASGQTESQAKKVERGHSQIQQPLYREYRGMRLG